MRLIKNKQIMEFLKLAKERYSCRMLTDRPVEQEKIDKIIECANNAQPGPRHFTRKSVDEIVIKK